MNFLFKRFITGQIRISINRISFYVNVGVLEYLFKFKFYIGMIKINFELKIVRLK